MKPGMDRREFLRTATRHTLLGGLLAGTGLLVLQQRKNPALTDDCLGPIACDGCGQFTGCALPRAMTQRAVSASEKPLNLPSPRSTGARVEPGQGASHV